MNQIRDEFYRLLAEDYCLTASDSVIYRHYADELAETVKRHSGPGKAERSKLPAAAKIYMAYNELSDKPAEKEIFDFIVSCFTGFVHVPELYSQPLRLRGEETIEKEVLGEKKTETKFFLNNKEEYAAIVDTVWPYLAPPLVLNENDRQELIGKRKKSSLHGLVKRLAEMLADTPEAAFEIYQKAGILKKDKRLEDLYRHVLDRSIEKSFKDFLYTEGYVFHRLEENEEETNNTNPDDESDKICYFDRLSGNGRKNSKPDKMVKLLSEICEKKNVYSLCSNNSDNLDDPEMAKNIKELYRFINDNYEGGDWIAFSLVLANDPHTGVSLQLLGNTFTGRNEPCAFAVLNRDEGNGIEISYKYTEDEDKDKDASLIIGKAESDGDAEAAYRIARTTYRRCVKESLWDIQEKDSDLYSDLVKNKRTGILKYFGDAMSDEYKDDCKKLREEERQEAERYVKEPSPYENLDMVVSK